MPGGHPFSYYLIPYHKCYIHQVQVQGFRLTQHYLNTCLVFYLITATRLKMVIRPKHAAAIK
jgi:hypothetical protein